jgi:hypothetical protein
VIKIVVYSVCLVYVMFVVFVCKFIEFLLALAHFVFQFVLCCVVLCCVESIVIIHLLAFSRCG